MSQPVRAHVDVEVRYAETDQMGVVHHANYLVWFELARTALCTQSGYHYADIERLGYLMMVTGAQVTYRRSARYGETTRVTCWLDAMASRSLRFAYRVTGPSGLLAEGATDHVWIVRASGRPCRVPEQFAEPFRRLAGTAGD